MEPTQVFLDPEQTLIAGVTAFLEGRCRVLPGGARSLDHVFLLVPTAQSGRQVRLSLARRFEGTGVVPPRIAQPKSLVVPAHPLLPEAPASVMEAAMLHFFREQDLTVWPELFRNPEALKQDVPTLLSFIGQLTELWSALASKGLLMRDVPGAAAECLAEAAGNELAYWEALGSLEAAFFEQLHTLGFCAPAEADAAAKDDPAPLPNGVEEVVLTSGLDPQPVLFPILDRLTEARPGLKLTLLLHAVPEDADRFDSWGRPLPEGWTGARAPQLTSLRDGDIFLTASDAALAELAASGYPEKASGRPVPVPGLLDDRLYSRLETAFRNRGYTLYQSVTRRLPASSLGRLALNLLELTESRRWPWATFAALLRSEDMMAVFAAEIEGFDRTALLQSLDDYRNAEIPQSVPESFGPVTVAASASEAAKRRAAMSAALTPVAELLRTWILAAKQGAPSPAETLRRLLERCYHRPASDEASMNEFLAAARALMGILKAAEAPGMPELPASDRSVLLRRNLTETGYDPESGEGDVLRTEGWLELAWSPNPRLALIGLHEGVVPDAIVGHPFLPDRLRAALGLKSNDERLARDTFLLATMLSSRRPGAVKAFVSLTDEAGDYRRPSRLLFLCDDATLPRRVRRLFGKPDGRRTTPSAVVPPAWQLRLPETIQPPKHLSASATDAYLACPFTYLLSRGLHMQEVGEKEELDAADYGHVLHAVLDRFAKSEGVNALRTPEEIRARLEACFTEKIREFGPAPTLNRRLQLKSIHARLMNFADLQAGLFADGWQIVASEYRLDSVELGAGFLYPLTAVIDRIDYKEGVGYRVLDYKTWDKASSARGKVVFTAGAEMDYAADVGLPTFALPASGRSTRTTTARWRSVQLPLYGRALEQAEPEHFLGKIAGYCYVVLGNSAATSGLFGDDAGFPMRRLAADALETAKHVQQRIREGLFWPPAPNAAWRYNFTSLFLNGPEADLDGSAWVESQNLRLRAFLDKEGGRA